MTLRKACFLLLAAACLAVPLGMVGMHEWALTHGQAFNFPLQIVDPADPFRGRYLALNFKYSTAAVPEGMAVRPGVEAYALVQEDGDGMSHFTELRQEPPADQPYIKVKVRRILKDGRADLKTPLDRFYLNERLAPAAEKAYARALRQDKREAWAVVRLWRGMAVLEDVMVEGTHLLQFAREAAATN